MIRLAATLICFAVPTQAEQHLAELYASILACDDASCVGGAAQFCMETEEGGFSTVGMMDCMNREAAVWDEQLNIAYADAMTVVMGLDRTDAVDFPQYAVREDQLRNAQRAWIAFRDANCTMEHGFWGAGSMRMLAGSACLLDMTAARTFTLRGYTELLP